MISTGVGVALKNSYLYGTNLCVSAKYHYLPDELNGRAFALLFKHKPVQDHTDVYEVVVKTSSILRAQYVVDLIICSLILYDGPASLEIGSLAAYPLAVNSKEKKVYEPTMYEYQNPDISTACQIAASASHKKAYIYSFFKYYLSCEIHTNHWMDLAPYYKDIPLSPFPYNHLRYSYAIVIAYSILEEIGLEVRASQKNPSTFKNGKRNPDVLNDLIYRLAAAKIDFNVPLLWHFRGSRKRIEIEKPIESKGLAPWSYGQIRDCDVSIVDAIYHLSWQRSKVASHKVNKNTKSLSVYDVSNAQYLARRLLMESLGFWRQEE
jgi:hypothetical protein